MPLEYSVESLEGLDESVKGLYVESDSGYKLDLSNGPTHTKSDIEGLEKNSKKLLAEKKTAQAELKKMQEEIEQIRLKSEEDEEKKQKDNGNWQKLAEDKQKKLEELQSTYDSFVSQTNQEKIDLANAKIGLELAKHGDDAPKRAKSLEKMASDYTFYEDGKVVYKIDGDVVEKSLVLDLLKTEYPFMVDGSQAKGSRAAGGSGDRVAEKIDFKGMSPTQKLSQARKTKDN